MCSSVRGRAWIWPALAALALLAACGTSDEAVRGGGTVGWGGLGGTGAVGPGGTAGGGGGGPGGQAGAAGAGTGASGGGGGSAAAGVDPSNGSGGPLGPGQSGATPKGAIVRLPAGYDPNVLASPVLWLFNEELPQWSAIADQDAVVLVDLDEYNDVDAIVGKLNDSLDVLEAQYNVDKARYYWAGWSAGGNLAIIIGAQNQEGLAGTLVFPGTGGNIAQPYMKANKGHKIRMFYACGDQDANYPWQAVQNEAQVWASYGYATEFANVPGSGHYIDEVQTGIRAQGWAWIKSFNLKN
ncbi:MAG: dienelactone hydrolase family protein [Deltaproteobacteria bacterium]|nr:dienelactone hydrolase family protein [Deltaproteobacteria bacterium]